MKLAPEGTGFVRGCCCLKSRRGYLHTRSVHGAEQYQPVPPFEFFDRIDALYAAWALAVRYNAKLALHLALKPL